MNEFDLVKVRGEVAQRVLQDVREEAKRLSDSEEEYDKLMAFYLFIIRARARAEKKYNKALFELYKRKI